MPGTPVMYYGDEIGMGDNIYLGDRDGVRTPMQWTADRNGGFSRADPQRLYLPPIMDPSTATRRSTSRRRSAQPVLAAQLDEAPHRVRQAHRSSAAARSHSCIRATARSLAYVRACEARSCSAWQISRARRKRSSLDLSRFTGRMPIEMLGWSAFPPIVDDRYVLTLPGQASSGSRSRQSG